MLPGFDPYRDAGDAIFDEAAARRAIDFVELCLTHTKGANFAGKPFLLVPWQLAIVGNLFGWRRPDGTRRFREVFIFVPRKNGKTELAAAIALAVLFCDDEPGAELYSAAADMDQASIVFNAAKTMMLQDELLARRGEAFARAVVYKGRSFKPISKAPGTKHGFNAHFVVVDELHAHANPELVDVLKTSMGTRSQPLILYTTTADYERPGSVCNEKQKYAEAVLSGSVDDPEFLPVVYKTEKDVDWTSPEVWRAANPNLGVSVRLDFLERECRQALEIPRYENEFRRLYLNQRTEQETRFLTMELWDKCVGVVDREELLGQDCVAGLDLSATTDITALVLVFRNARRRYRLLPFLFVPKDAAVERARRDKVRYREWIAEGLLIETPGEVVDHLAVVEAIKNLRHQYNIQEVAIDPANATAVASMLEQEGIERVLFGQSFLHMNAPTKELERLVIAGELEHGGHDVLRWMAQNVAVETDHSGRLRPSKKKSFEKIDGIVAAIMGIGRWMAGPEKAESVYKRRGLAKL